MNKRGYIVIGTVLILGLATFATFLADHAATGTDDRAVEQIDALTGGAYEPWAQAQGVPGGERNAPILFGVQAGAGIAVLAACLWYWREHRSGA